MHGGEGDGVAENKLGSVKIKAVSHATIEAVATDGSAEAFGRGCMKAQLVCAASQRAQCRL